MLRMVRKVVPKASTCSGKIFLPLKKVWGVAGGKGMDLQNPIEITDELIGWAIDVFNISEYEQY